MVEVWWIQCPFIECMVEVWWILCPFIERMVEVWWIQCPFTECMVEVWWIQCPFIECMVSLFSQSPVDCDHVHTQGLDSPLLHNPMACARYQGPG